MDINSLLLKIQKPTRYSGGEYGSVMKSEDIPVRFAFCFPDLYEIGMSHLGLRIIYSLLNKQDYVWCERAFAAAKDFEDVLLEHDIPLFAIESRTPLRDFDIVGFTLQYELSYTNILKMLKLAKIPLLKSERDDSYPLIIAGGPCAYNPEPLADFIDVFVVGDGEEAVLEITQAYKNATKNGTRPNKKELLEQISAFDGIYIPSFYDVEYNADNTIKKYMKNNPKAPKSIKKAVIKDLNNTFNLTDTIVPFGEIVHDRAYLELFRGCIRGCRFCQAGFVYRPVREKNADMLNTTAKELIDMTGYDEISLASLSTSDYTQLPELLDSMLEWTQDAHVNISLPSLRADNFSYELMEKVRKVRKSTLTFAPEAGTQRLRDVINKNVTEDDLLNACKAAFEGGYITVKLYFMIGLPYETDEDIIGIAKLAQRVVDLYYSLENRQKGKSVAVTISVACYIPKPFTPFQLEAQNSAQELRRKQMLLKESITSKKIKFNYHDNMTSILEAVFARGDRRLGEVLVNALENGCAFDDQYEKFNFSYWQNAFEKANIDMDFYIARNRNPDEVLPWDIIDIGISKKFFINENKKAADGIVTPNCREKCSGCGLKC